MAEFAVLCPFFLLAAVGTIEFGRAMHVSQLLEQAAREGARTASLDVQSSANVLTEVHRVMQASKIPQSSYTVDIDVYDKQGNLQSWNEVAGATEDHVCTVTVVVPFENVRLFPAPIFGSYSLSGFCSMRRQP